MTDLYRLTVVLKAPGANSLQFSFSSEAAVIAAYQKLIDAPPLLGMNAGALGDIDFSSLRKTESVSVAAATFERVFDPIEIIDGYGICATIDRSQIAAVLRTYVNEALNAQQDEALLQARAQSQVQKKIQADPTLRQAVQMPGAPNGFMRQQ